MGYVFAQLYSDGLPGQHAGTIVKEIDSRNRLGARIIGYGAMVFKSPPTKLVDQTPSYGLRVPSY